MMMGWTGGGGDVVRGAAAGGGRLSETIDDDIPF